MVSCATYSYCWEAPARLPADWVALLLMVLCRFFTARALASCRSSKCFTCGRKQVRGQAMVR
jgi:hypothetical protein